MKNKTYILEVMTLTGITLEEYHEFVINFGKLHLIDLINRLTPIEIKPILDHTMVYNEVLQKPHYNFWRYFRGVMVQKNKRLVNNFAELYSPAIKELLQNEYSEDEFHSTMNSTSSGEPFNQDFFRKVWLKSLEPYRIKSTPHEPFQRLLTSLIKNILTHRHETGNN